MKPKGMAVTAIVTLFAAAGCQSTAQTKEESLAAAGFQMKEATTPQQIAHVQSLPQRKLTPVSRDGNVMYVYADAKDCNCIYVGTQDAYGRYQNLAIHEQIAEEEEMASMDWDMWGGWGPFW